MSRPLMAYRIDQLDEMFIEFKSTPAMLKMLEYELQYRKVPRAVSLLTDVQAAMYRADPTPSSVAAPPAQNIAPLPSEGKQSSLWVGPATSAVATTFVEKLQAATPEIGQAAPKHRSPLPPLQEMPLEEACRVLQTNLGATWESIEQARRRLVERSHPGLLKSLNDARRAQALTDAQRANAAYAKLEATRRGRN